MPREVSKSRRRIMEELAGDIHYDWAAGMPAGHAPDAEEAAENERRMAERYRAWAGKNLVTYTYSPYESARRTYPDAPLETVNPIDDTVEPPEPYYDVKEGKWHVPKNIFDGNTLSRRRFLFEMDGIALEDQRILLEPLLERRIIQRVVFSGHKSLHCVIEEADEPDDKEQYQWAWRFMAREFFRDMRFHCLRLPVSIDKDFSEVVDSACSHPSRETRTPFAIRKDGKTGGKPVEQKLLYFENVRADSGWRRGWNAVKARYEAELERTRRQAQRGAWKYRSRENRIPNEAARRFMSADMSDGWKHASLGSAVASLAACGYSREEVAGIFRPYKKELRTFAMHAWDYFENRDRGKAADYFAGKNGAFGAGLAAEAMG